RIRLFNPTFFNKWTLFEWLNKSIKTKRYIPVTRKLVKLSNLQLLMKRFPVLYLKPLHGKAGSGIMRIKKNPPGSKGYQLTVQENKNTQTFTYTSSAKLWAKVNAFIGSEEYIVQQGIHLASNHKRPFDLRVLVQKNKKGKWTLTGIGARVAGILNITTHVPRGGSIEDPEKLLVAAFGDRKAKGILAAAKRAALRITRQIERGSGQTLGEMSIDLGVDTAGQLWFFEANAKPMKFDEPHIRSKSLEHLIQYCIYLSKPRHPEKK
ncbi:MAG TPA: YheC/YheD family protein, partial [Bacilli bacterium]